MADSVRLVPPEPGWAELAQVELVRFTALLDSLYVMGHHIGSTSIPGIQAKPVLDLMPVVSSVERLDGQDALFEAAGYRVWGAYGLPGRRFFTRDEAGERIANIHVYAQGNPEITRHLAFRDYLRSHPDIAVEYEREKLGCQRACPDSVHAYNDCKNSWIRATERAALAWSEYSRQEGI